MRGEKGGREREGRFGEGVTLFFGGIWSLPGDPFRDFMRDASGPVVIRLQAPNFYRRFAYLTHQIHPRTRRLLFGPAAEPLQRGCTT